MKQREYSGHVKEGYQVMRSLERDKKGYQPAGEKPSNPQPPNLGSAAVVPSNGQPQSGGTGSGKSQGDSAKATSE